MSLGLLGMTRRLQHYEVAAWRPWVLIAGLGIIILLIGAIAQVIQLVVSIRQRDALRDETGDPWDGRSLEWATASPPPAFNFAVLPNVGGEEPYWQIKRRAIETAAIGAGTDLQSDRGTPQQPGRIHHRLLRDHHRLRVDLAHLVAGRASAWRPPMWSSSGSPGGM